MMSVVLKFIDSIFSSTDSYISILFVVLALLIIAEINKKAGLLPKYILISSICICLEYLLLDFTWRTKKSKIMLFILLLMLGMLMGFENSVLLKQYVVFDDSMQIKKSREWIDFTELKLEIDVLHLDGIFFAPNQHPLQNGLERKENERALVYNIEIALQSFKENEQHALQEVCTLINSELPSECPEISELHVAFDDVMLPVGCMK